MTLPAWPAALPLPKVGSVTITTTDPAVRSAIAMGTPQARLRFRRQVAATPLRLTMNDVQLAIFEAWFRQTISNGAAWFTMSLLGETGLATHTVRLLGGYAAGLQTLGAWDVTMRLAVESPPQGA